MSYARIGPDSDVYLFGTHDSSGTSVVECCGCKLTEDRRHATAEEYAADPTLRRAEIGVNKGKPLMWNFGPVQHFPTKEAALAHLDAHIAAGDKVPDYAINRVRDDNGWLT